MFREIDDGSLRVISSQMKTGGWANEKLSGGQSAGVILRAGQLTGVRQRADERQLPAVRAGNYLLDCQRLSGREKEHGCVARKIQVFINIFSVGFFLP